VTLLLELEQILALPPVT